MVPGFVLLGLLAVLFQVVVIAGLYGYLRYRHPVGRPETRTRVVRLLGGGAALAALGQVVALGAIGSLWVSPLLSFERALLVQDAGLAVALVGYLGVGAGFVVHGRAGR